MAGRHPHRTRRRRGTLPVPTLRGTLNLAVACCLIVLGGEIALDALIVWGVALIAAMALGLAQALMPLARPGRRARLYALFAPRVYLLDTCWEKLDQHGRVIETLPAREMPQDRGWYRMPAATLRVRDALGMWRRDRRMEHGAETFITPQGTGAGALSTLLRRLGSSARDAQRTLDSSQVRQYEKGDPMRAISWRQTAHHGTLMSFEPVRDEPPAPIVVADTLGCSRPDDLALACARVYSELLRRPGATPAPVTDGTDVYRAPVAVDRFLAALQPDSPPFDGSVPPAGVLRDAAKSRALEVRRLLGRQTDKHDAVVLVTEQAGGVLERELRAILPATALIRVDARTGRLGLVRRAEDPEEKQRPGEPAAPESPQLDWMDKAAARRPRHTPLAVDLAAAVCCVGGLLLALALSRALAEPAYWYTASCLTFSIVALEGTLGKRLPGCRRPLVRAILKLVCVVAVTALAIVGADHVIQADVGLDLLGDPRAYLGLGTWAREAPGPISAAVMQGVADLYFGQWVPLVVEGTADAALTLLVAGCAALLFLPVTSCAVLRPLCGAFPLVVMAACQLLLGTPPEPAAVAAGVAIFLVLGGLDAWLYDDEPPLPPAAVASLAEGAVDVRDREASPRADGAASSRPALPQRVARAAYAALASLLPVALGAAIAAGAGCALGEQALSWEQSLPIDTGLTSTMFSSNAVSPVVDLRRELTRGAETQALHYATDAGHPLYLRLSVLSNFTGDTWLIDSSLGGDASTGIPLIDQLFAGDSGASNGAPALPGDGSDGSAYIEAVAATGAGIGAVESVTAEITIDGVVSRLVPTPLGTYQTAADDPEQGDWTWGADGVIFGTSSTTWTGQAYQTSSAYLSPVTSTADIEELSALADALTRSFVFSGSPSLPSDIGARYLNLPGDLPQAMVEVIGGAASAGVPGELEDASDELAALRYLVGFFTGGDFTYSTSAPDGDGHDALEVMGDFLERREGYCVHYASTFALLARALGVPSRVAIGYGPSVEELGGGTYAATNHDLHAWTEVYLVDVGWIAVDVTPGTGTSAAAGDDEGTSAEPPAATDPDTPAAQPETPAAAETNPQTPGDTSSDSAADPAFELLASASRVAAAAWDALRRALPVLGAAGIAGLALATPLIIRHRRRARRLRIVDSETEGPSQIAKAAWDELVDSAYDRGIAPSPAATEEELARAIGSALAQGAAVSTRRPAALRTGSAKRHEDAQDARRALELVMRAACIARYGTPQSPQGEPAELRRAFHGADAAIAQLRAASQEPAANRGLARVRRALAMLSLRLLPRSVFVRPPDIVARSTRRLARARAKKSRSDGSV